MSRIIKITENQEKQLKEEQGDSFEFLDSDNGTPSHVGNSQIGVTGKVEDNEYGKPATSDKIGNALTVQGFNRYNRRYGGNVMPIGIRENDVNNDGVDDFYNHDELDILSDGDDENNLMRVPQSVEHKLDNLLSVLKDMPPKQQAMVINKLIETVKLDKIPYSWAKELMLKIQTRNNISKQN